MKKINFKSKPRYAARITSRALRLRDFSNVAYLADILNQANCASPDSVFNTGIPLCDVSKKKMKAVIFADSGVTFSGADLASVPAFIAAVKEKTTAARGGRVYPVWDLLNFEDNTGDPATGGIGNLSTATIITSEAVPAFSFGYNGTEARHQRMSSMNSMSLDVFFVDDAWVVYGTANGDGLSGYDVLQAYADTSKFIVSDAVNQYRFRVTLGNIAQYRDSTRYVVTNSGILTAVGLINVQLSQLSAVDNVHKIQAISDGGTNLEPLHGAALAGLTWTAQNLETGDVFVVTSSADDAALDAFTITLDTTAWAALATGDRVQINGPTAAAMAAAGVKPFEMLSVIVVKEA